MKKRQKRARPRQGRTKNKTPKQQERAAALKKALHEKYMRQQQRRLLVATTELKMIYGNVPSGSHGQ